MELQKERNISKYRDAKKRLKKSMCHICGLCKVDQDGRFRAKNCAESVNFKIIDECIDNLEKEWKNEQH